MTRVGILSVGDELLAGDLLDTNQHWLAQELASRGHKLICTACVGDNVQAIRQALERAAEDCELLLITGGLGPTQDDLTRDGVAAAFETELVEFSEYLGQAQGPHAKLSEGSRRQASFPMGATVLENARGTAPGFEIGGVVGAHPELRVACFPGVPLELRPMVSAFLDSLGGGTGVAARKLMCSGVSESTVAEVLGELMRRERSHCVVGVTASLGVLTVTMRGDDEDAVFATFLAARERLGEAVFSSGEASHAEVVVKQLLERGLLVSTAESCTGGLLAGALTSVPGSSAAIREALVVYSDEAKVQRLGIPEQLIAEHGVVSEPVAAAMAEAQRVNSGADVAISITGIAGPEGGSVDQPVGTVVFGLATADDTLVRSEQWRGGREAIRMRSVTYALEMLRRLFLRS
ncbi:MAG: nicotinamide-nucleotide amidohydrolase family protein [Planctomycetota bacterium]|jgi:nicotinamide-nucleotide amidase|nr:nicotinamide-nucleotide amidohydrolase family protein [Planctomycetota bacterium]